MTEIPISRISPASQDKDANEAWRVHSALVKAEGAAPALADDPRFITLRMDAYERFSRLFGGTV